jgi:diguanylate cyclase (GGDEF)-like protein
MKLSFRCSLLLVMVLVSLVPIISMAVWSNHNVFEDEYRTVEEKHLLLAKNVSQALERYAIDALAIFTRASDSVVSQTLATEFIQLMQDVDVVSLGEFDQYGKLQAVIFGPENSQPTSLTSSLNPFNMTDINRSRFTPIHKKGVTKPTLYMIRQSDDKRIWLATMHSSYIQQLQSAVKFGQGGHAAIVDQQGNVLAHPDKLWQQESKNISAISVVQNMMMGGSGVMAFYSPAVKADMIAGYTVVPSTGWGVMIPQPKSELLARADEQAGIILTLAISAFIVCVVISWWISGLITRPIALLIDTTNGLTSAPNTLKKLSLSRLTTKEFVQLFESFNHMSEEIKKSRYELERRVADRTADLAQAQTKAMHLANHDMVTGLPNRMAIRDMIQNLLSEKRHFSLLFIDLDGFKLINDNYGHGIGDLLLNEVAKRVSRDLFHGDIIARYGGDEFIVLLPNKDQAQTANFVANKVLDIIKLPYELEGHTLFVGACIGVALCHGDDVDTDSLIHRADIAMYKAKHNGKDQISIAQDAVYCDS